MEIKLTLEEAQATLQLIDLAVKHAGLQVSEVATIISKKITSQFPKQNNAPETQSSTDPDVKLEDLEDKK